MHDAKCTISIIREQKCNLLAEGCKLSELYVELNTWKPSICIPVVLSLF
jgi:hypothetical protein